MTLTLSATNISAAYVGANKNLVDVSRTDALSPFPLHNLMSTIQATINSNTVSLQVQDVLPQLLRLNNKNDLLAYNGSTPVAYDTFLNYSDAVNFITNPLGGINNSTDEDINYRGCYGVTLGAAPIPTPPNPATVYTQTVTFEVFEPFLLLPFMFGQPQNQGGMYGVNNMSFSMNVGNLQRAWRHAVIDTGVAAQDRSWNISVSSVSFSNSEMIFNFLTPPPSLHPPARCVVPYYELNRYLLTNQNASTINAGVTDTIQSNALNIPTMPDKFIICVRKPMSSQTCQDADAFWQISKINMTFNNKAGYCSGWQPVDFYKSAREAGSNQSWLEFQGTANAIASGASGVNAIKTSGSLVVLEINKDICLTEEFISAGVSGTYSLQFSVECTNPYGVALRPELVLIALNSGVFSLEDGRSEVKTALLLPSQVVDAKATEPVARMDVKRMVGAGFFDNLRNAWKKASPYIKQGVNFGDSVAGSGLSASGLSAFGLSAAGMSRDALHRTDERKSLKDRLR